MRQDRYILFVFLALAGGCTQPVPAGAGLHRFAASPDRLFLGHEAEIRYRDLSLGVPVLLLHGFADRLETMEALADSLAPTHRVIALDLRGFGSSSKFSDPARYGQAMLNDVLALMDHLGIERTHVIGYSLGALLAARLVERHPGRVITATFLGGPFFPDEKQAAELLMPFADSIEVGSGLEPMFGWVFPSWQDSLLHAVSDSVEQANDRGALVAVLRSVPALTLDPGVATAPVPVLAIVGTRDPVRPMSRTLVQRWSGAQLVEVNGADHESILTVPQYMEKVRAHVDPERRARPPRFAEQEGRRGTPRS